MIFPTGTFKPHRSSQSFTPPRNLKLRKITDQGVIPTTYQITPDKPIVMPNDLPWLLNFLSINTLLTKPREI
jgi:hypothetical protein